MTTTRPPAVRAYLDELHTLLGGSPDRELVVDGVARHIEDALGDGAADPSKVQAVLDELGDPAVIAADSAPAPVVRAPFLQRRAGAVLTVLLLAVGGIVVPVAGWIVGLGLLWFSRGWRVVDRIVGTLAPFALAAIAAGVAALLGATAPWHLAVILGIAANAVLVPVFLLRRFRARA